MAIKSIMIGGRPHVTGLIGLKKHKNGRIEPIGLHNLGVSAKKPENIVIVDCDAYEKAIYSKKNVIVTILDTFFNKLTDAQKAYIKKTKMKNPYYKILSRGKNINSMEKSIKLVSDAMVQKILQSLYQKKAILSLRLPIDGQMAKFVVKPEFKPGL